MDSHLVDDAEARVSALDVTRSFIVQAPAGSGKTELLIQRYLNLLSVVEHPEEVLAITFTRKASAEMQHRVLDALRRRQDNDEPTEPHLRLTYDLAGAALAKSRELEWDLIGNPRRMRILTLDALNASIARVQPLSSPHSASGAVVVGAQLQDVHRAAAIATLDWLAESGDMQVATQEVLRHVDNSIGLYVSYLAQMLATRDQWLPFIGSGSLSAAAAVLLRQKFEQSLEFAVNEHLRLTADGLADERYAELSTLFEFAVTNILDAGLSSPVGELAGLEQLPDAEAAATPQWLGVADLLLTQKGEFRKRVDKRQGFPPGNKEQKDRIQGLLQELAEDEELAANLQGVRALPPVRYSDEQWSVLLALFRLLPLAVTELKRLFGERGIVDYVDVALTAGAALGSAENPGDVALLLDYKVQHLLVDEMQDTSSAQYRMLEALTGGWQDGDGRSLFCVGDPMQSIYRFRNAEVGQFLLARKFGIANIRLEPLLLRRNFRSGERLVEWFNDVFPTILSRQDDPLRGAVSYSAAVSVPRLAGQGACVIHPVFGAVVEDEAARGCALIAQTLADNPDDDMAVLVRGRTQLPQLLAELRAAGVAYQAVEIDRLTDLPEIIEVLALTRAAVHLGDRIAWLALLRAPWIGLDWSDLHALVRNDTHSTVWELLQDEQRLQSLSADGQRALDNVHDVLMSVALPRRAQSLRDWVEHCWIALGGPGVLCDDHAVDNVYLYFDVLEKIEQAGTLADVAELEAILDLERVSSNDTARLQIMTMHRAKGLQFDHVLLYGLGRQPGHGDRRVLSWFDMPSQHGDERKVISPVGPRAEIDNDPVHRYIELKDAEKNRHEQARLLYVACTRARKSLHLLGNTAISSDGESFRPARSDSLLHLLWPAVAAEFEQAFSGREKSAGGDFDTVWALPKLRRFASHWSLPEVELLTDTTQTADTTVTDNEVEFYWVGSDARIAGTLVHRWMQLMADGHASKDPADLALTRTTTTRWLQEMGMGEEVAQPILQRVEQALQATLSDAQGQWILAGDGHAELALTGVIDGALASVVLDRVRVDEDGTHWIVDYKTSTHEGGNLQGFLQVEADRYRAQLARYAEVYRNWSGTDAKCALYFPLLQSFVEVST